MTTQFKNPINNFGPIFLMLMAMFVLGFGCNASDSLKGWTSHNANLDPPNQTNYFTSKIYYIDKAILDDYPKFIEQLKTEKKYPTIIVSKVDFYEDGTGQHAVKLTMEVDLREYVEYYLMYDKSNVRTKV